HNSVILARSGEGKSYLAKLETMRSLYDGIEIAAVEHEAEYSRLAATAAGAYVHLGAPGVRFFFNADAGIRDWSVTGVQTCALPISAEAQARRQAWREAIDGIDPGQLIFLDRSEERRAGKEWRSRWAPYPLKKT